MTPLPLFQYSSLILEFSETFVLIYAAPRSPSGESSSTVSGLAAQHTFVHPEKWIVEELFSVMYHPLPAARCPACDEVYLRIVFYY